MSVGLQEEKPLTRPRVLDTIRMAVVGCGAMSRDFHLPVLAGHTEVRLVALVDRDTTRAAELAKAYGVEKVLANASDLGPDLVDAAIIATPPFHHAPGTIELVRRGIHVLVEKPMALTSADAEAMVRAAEEAGVVLAVGHHRRLFHSTRMLRAILKGGMLGRPLSFDVEEGGPYGWPLATLSNLRKDQGGGGVLVDIGCHLLDQLLFCFAGAAEVLEYRDNALGGIETDAFARLRIQFQGEPVEGRVELSRTRELRNTIRIECERGTLELANGERYRVSVRPRGTELVDPLPGLPQAFRLQAAWDGVTETVGRGAYRVEMDDWFAAIRSGQPPLLSGRSAVAVVKLIEECYRCTRPLVEPWVEEGTRRSDLSSPNGVAAHWNGAAVPATAGPAAEKANAVRRVLVTGATGFIGCRVAEILHLREGYQVRALVHNPGSAARLARLPVEMVSGDLQSPADAARAVAGCDAVVHCAVPPSWWTLRQTCAVTVGGTQNLAEAALTAGVQRFVHLSTISVYGSDVSGVVDETTPVRPDRGSVYGHSKLKAEQVIERAVRKGLPAVVFRPAHVYGPFGKTFTVRPVQFLARGALVLVDGDRIPANMIYVDNVAGAVARALVAPVEAVRGQTFTLSGEDDLTWADFYRYFADALAVPLRVIPAEEHSRSKPRGRDWFPMRWLKSWYHGSRELVSSAEFRALGRKFVQTDPFGIPPRWLLEHLPGLRKLLGLDVPLIYRPPETKAASSGDLLTMTPIAARISIDKARRVLGYEPLVSRERAQELTLDWLRHSRMV